MSDAEDRRDPFLDLTGPRLPAHFYMHVPFCRIKCSYCDFFSVDDLDGDVIESVLRGIEAQLDQWAGSALPGVVETVYIGGGTPTVIVGGALRLVRAATERLPVRAGAEVTVEANPDSLVPDLAEALAAAGTTRISVGIQSFAEKDLALLGRVHTVDEAVAACSAVRDAGVDLSVDLMCGIPGQSLASWTETVSRAIATGASHISVYALTLEEGTPLDVACGTGLVPQPDPDLAADQMLVAEEALAREGLRRYEISNFAIPGHESRHNEAYWTGSPYAGIGPGAHGMLDVATARSIGMLGEDGRLLGEDIVRVRWSNAADPAGWLTSAPHDVEVFDRSLATREDAMLGLRLTRGISHRLADEAGVTDVLRSLNAEGLVDSRGEGPGATWRLSRRGWLLGNEVFSRVWTAE